MGVSAISPDRPLVVWHPGATPPAGYIKANGALLSRSVYAWLFGKIGETFGAGDGSTTFSVPDLRAEVLRGLDDGRGVDVGRVLGSAQADAMQGHWHERWATTFNQLSQGGGTKAADFNAGNTTLATGNDQVRAAIADGVNGTPRTAGETRMRNIAGLYCIAYAP